jgi:anti-sigma regulatory factor (Ser/Thr protein kinase)
MRYSRRFPQLSASVPEARAYVAETLAQLPADMVERIVLMVSELVTNVIVHAQTAVELELLQEIGDKRVRIVVTDEGGGRPNPRAPSNLEAHGRGLQIVEALSDQWGIEYLPNSKSVWFSVDL